jgi:LacI family transcriptional regulator
VGTSTVSRVINGKGDVSADKRKRIEKAIRDSGFIPSVAARAMKSDNPYRVSPGRTIQIVAQAEEYKGFFLNELLSHLVSEAAGTGYQVIISFPSQRSVGERAAGVILVNRLKAVSIKASSVTVDYFSDDPLIPGVLPDYETGIYQAARVALGRGYKNPVLLAGLDLGPGNDFDSMMYRGFRRALLEEGFNPEKFRPLEQGITKERGYAVAKKLLASSGRPDIIFTTDDGALGVYRAAFELGIRIPEDLGVVGCDGVSASEYMTPALATIKIDYQKLARETLNRLLPAIGKTAGPKPQKLLLETVFTDNRSIRRSE